ncbi:MAG: hypothetical protein HUU06_09695, partial [Planctomycetaceae bacterium]|nr:hypothetical protein [Planctomycetaceae bacterium]
GSLVLDTGAGPSTLGWGLVEDGRRYPAEDLAPALAGQGMPTLLVHGKRDDSCDWRESAAFAGRVPGARLVLLEDGDHRLSAHRERLCDEVERFVADLRPPS